MLKRIGSLLIIIFALTLFTANVTPAQEDIDINRIDGTSLVSITTDVDSVIAGVYSDWFTIGKYDGVDLSTYPVYYTKKYTSAAGKPYVTVILQGSNNQEDIVASDTLGGVQDSLETLYKGTLSITGNKYLYWRLKFVGESKSTTLKNRSDTVVYTDLLFTKPE